MKDPIAQIKAWLFPSLISILAGIIWNDVQEIKSDVKALMAQSNIYKTRIDNLERLTYKSRTTSSNFPGNNKKSDESMILVAVMPNNKDVENSIQIKKRTL
jgi:hypothetical protein